ncbi:MAG: 3-phosphoshikimate 1-carboxyvinyltransferase [Lentisphaerota bacterium]
MSTPRQMVIVHPAAFKGGVLEVPGDKSISHRVAMLSAIASGKSPIKNFLQAEDCLNTLRAMEALGARTSFSENGDLSIQGTGGMILQPVGPLNLGNSGTGMRLLAGLMAGMPINVEMTGDESLCSRPMKRIQDPLLKMGAKIELTPPKGTAPIRIQGGGLKAINYPMPVASAQVKSCILLAGLYAEGITTVIEPLPTRDHTERLLKAFGVPLEIDGAKITLHGYGVKGPSLLARPWMIPGDFSSAAYWLVAAAVNPGAKVTVKNAGLNPRRTALLDVLLRMGASITVTKRHSKADTEFFGDIEVLGTNLKATEIGGAEIPNLIDEIPILCVAAALADGRTIIRDAAELRVKESDRIASMVGNLKLMGVKAEERPDGLVIDGPSEIKTSGSVRSFGDHRIAMSMAILALHADAPLCINNVACVETSYPGFWDDLRSLGVQVE